MPGGPFLLLIPILMVCYVISPDLADTVGDKMLEGMTALAQWLTANSEEVNAFLRPIFEFFGQF